MLDNYTIFNHIDDLLNFIYKLKKIMPLKNKYKISYFILLNINIYLFQYLLIYKYGIKVNYNMPYLLLIILGCFNVLAFNLYNTYEKYDNIINTDIYFLHKLNNRDKDAIIKIKRNNNIMNNILNHIQKFIHLILIIKISYILMIIISFILMIMVSINI